YLSHSPKNRTVDFFLHRRKTRLEEVIIHSKREKIRVNRDTLFYDPRAFLDGSEQTVEDLLSKLPGIQVKENGRILYKGKQIKKLMLDGDDIFGADYQIGTRNINVDMIDEVQAIDHYNDNPLLKSLIDSKDVAINLKIKKVKRGFPVMQIWGMVLKIGMTNR